MTYHNTLDSVVFYQTAAENYALYRQSFALAKLQLEAEMARRLAGGADPESFYIITDCDETVLDNCAYNSWQIETGHDFHGDTWRLWCNEKKAKATPGATEFLKHVASLGVKICYVSSRFEDTRGVTAENLTAAGLEFPLTNASDDPASSFLFLDGMMIDGKATTKREQFPFLAERFKALPLVQMGDNLSDHSTDLFRSALGNQTRLANAVANGARWGADWIVFPNSIYGAWRRSLRLVVDGVEQKVTDELVPVPEQPTKVRDAVLPTESLKVAMVERWSPNPELP